MLIGLEWEVGELEVVIESMQHAWSFDLLNNEWLSRQLHLGPKTIENILWINLLLYKQLYQQLYRFHCHRNTHTIHILLSVRAYPRIESLSRYLSLATENRSQSRTVANSIASRTKHYGVTSAIVAILLAMCARSDVDPALSYLISNIHDKPVAATLLKCVCDHRAQVRLPARSHNVCVPAPQGTEIEVIDSTTQILHMVSDISVSNTPVQRNTVRNITLTAIAITTKPIGRLQR